MADEKTASEIKGHYDPMPLTIIKVGEKEYGYDFKSLAFLQMCHAQELAQWKKDQVENMPKDYRTIEQSGSNEYVLRLASILFTPCIEGEPMKFKRNMPEATRLAFEDITNKDDVQLIERCLIDFFTLRGQRRLASATLSRNGSSFTQVMNMLGPMAQLLTPSLNKNDSSIPESSKGE